MSAPTTADLMTELSLDAQIRVGRLRATSLSRELAEKLILNQCGQSRTPLGSIVFDTLRVGRATVRRALLVFGFKKPPAFLPATSSLREQRYGFVLLLSWRKWIAIAYSGMSWSEKAARDIVDPLDYVTMRAFAGTVATAYERLRLHNLSIADGVVHAQTLEAADLDGVMPMLAVGRQVVRNARVRDESSLAWSMGLGTARLRQSRGRGPLDRFSQFCLETFRRIEKLTTASGEAFLDAFATPVKLSQLPPSVRPTGVLLRVRPLEDALASGALVLERKGAKGGYRQIDGGVAARMVARFSRAMAVTSDPKTQQLHVHHPSFGDIGELKVNEQSYSLRGSAQKLWLTDASGDRETVSAWVRARNALHVVYSDIRYAYAGNQLFCDDGVASQIGSLKSILKPEGCLSAAASEKGEAGELQQTSTRFPPTSVFSIIEDTVGQDEDYLACDDLGDEWADFVGIKKGDPPRLTFYHAKHGDTRVSGTAFHELVGQAQKNLGRILATRGELHGKRAKWAQVFRLDGTQTQIARVRRAAGGSADDVVDAVLLALEHPGVRARVVLVTPALQHAALVAELQGVERALARPGGSGRGKPLVKYNVAQAIWILASFASSCRSFGFEPVVVCRP